MKNFPILESLSINGTLEMHALRRKINFISLNEDFILIGSSSNFRIIYLAED